MDPECWDWAASMARKRPDLHGTELRNYQHEIAERRILDRFARHGHI